MRGNIEASLKSAYYVDRKADRWVYITKDKDGEWRTSHFKGLRMYSSKAYASKADATRAAEQIKTRFATQKPARRKAPARRENRQSYIDRLLGGGF